MLMGEGKGSDLEGNVSRMLQGRGAGEHQRKNCLHGMPRSSWAMTILNE